MNNKIILESLSMDLLRVALGLHRGSRKMAERFSQEALARKNEIELQEIKPYLKKILYNMELIMQAANSEKKAEDALMYSICIRNYSQTFYKK